MYYGPWVFARKPQETSERPNKDEPPVTLIHDHEAARALGFQAGFVGGLNLLSIAESAIDAGIGHVWYEGGALSVRNRAPVYECDLRACWEHIPPQPGESRRIKYHLVDREGKESTHGWAAVPRAGARPVPPWEREPVRHTSVGEDVLPELVVGQTRKPFEITVNLEDAVKSLDEIRDYMAWYRYGSPWGGPILSAFEICFALYQGKPQIRSNILRSPRLVTSMDAGTDLVVYEPLFADRTYLMKPQLVDKWQTEKTVFFTTEYVYEDEKGKTVALMRANSAHLIRALAPPESV